MSQRVHVRIISLLEDAANSIEQLETLTNRALASIPAEAVDGIEFKEVAREVVDDAGEPFSECDQLVIVRYRSDDDGN